MYTLHFPRSPGPARGLTRLVEPRLPVPPRPLQPLPTFGGPDVFDEIGRLLATSRRSLVRVGEDPAGIGEGGVRIEVGEDFGSRGGGGGSNATSRPRTSQPHGTNNLLDDIIFMLSMGS